MNNVNPLFALLSLGFIVVLVGVILKAEEKNGSVTTLFQGFGGAYGNILSTLEGAG
jgi:hypothetical protein